MKTLGSFASKQSVLDELKLDVAIAEQKAKLQGLKEGKPASPVIPVIQPRLVQPAVMPAELPSLPVTVNPADFPPLGAVPAMPSRRSGLVAIQGVDGSLSAVFATASGKKTVRVGDSIQGGKVRAITLDSVTLTSGKTISIEE